MGMEPGQNEKGQEVQPKPAPKLTERPVTMEGRMKMEFTPLPIYRVEWDDCISDADPGL